jgi:chorismate mutase
MVDHPSVPPSLVSVRRDLERIDRAIVLLVAARLEAAGSAIRLRSRGNGPIADPVQESRVIARARAWAEQLGVSPELAETLFRAIVEAGKQRYRGSSPAPAPGRRPSGSQQARHRAAVPRSASNWARPGRVAPS